MAWNKYYIFIKNPNIADINYILKKLQLDNYKADTEVSICQTNKPTTLYAGFYNGSLILVHPDLPFQFYRQTPSDTEKRFIELFPQSEITSLVENSTVNLFGYSIIENSKRIRILEGSEGTYHISIGNKIPEEMASLKQTTFDLEEINCMKQDGMSEENIEKLRVFESQWRVPSLLTRRYLGRSIDEIDTNTVILNKYVSIERDNFESSPKEREIQNLIEHIRKISKEIK